MRGCCGTEEMWQLWRRTGLLQKTERGDRKGLLQKTERGDKKVEDRHENIQNAGGMFSIQKFLTKSFSMQVLKGQCPEVFDFWFFS